MEQGDSSAARDALRGDLAAHDLRTPHMSEPDLFGPGTSDLELQNLQLTPTTIARGGHPTAVSFRVVNRGPERLDDARVHLECYLISRPTFEESASAYCGGIGLNYTLGVGDAKDSNLSATGLSYVTIPQVPPGTHYVFAKIAFAPPSTLRDPRTANNLTMLVAPITVR